MSHTTSSIMIDQPQLSILEKLAAWFSWLGAGFVFFHVGWEVMAPHDPHGAVSLLTHHSVAAMLIQSCALACVIAVMTSCIAGRKRSDIGAMSAAVGLAIVSFRGDTTAQMLVHETDSATSSFRGLAFFFALESVAWLVVIAITLFLSGWVSHRLFRQRSSDHPSSIDANRWLSIYDVPRWGSLLTEKTKMNRTSLREGLKHTAMMSGIGLVAFGVLSAGLSSRAIQHGQSCFVVAASVTIGYYFTFRYVTVYSALWSLLAVGLMATLGYIGSSLFVPGVQEQASIPASPFMRVLPIQFIAIGTISAILMSWSVQIHIMFAEAQNKITGQHKKK